MKFWELPNKKEKQTASIMAKAIGSTTEEVEKVAGIVKEANEAMSVGYREKPITVEEVVKLIDEYDNNPHKTKMDFYTTHMKIVLGNEMVSLETWDNAYTQTDRDAAYKKAEPIIDKAIKIREERT